MRRIWNWITITATNRLPDGRQIPEPRQYLVTPAYGPQPRKIKKVSVWRDEIELEGNIFVSLEWGDWEWEPYPLILMRKINERIQKFIDENPVAIFTDVSGAIAQMTAIRDQCEAHYNRQPLTDFQTEEDRRKLMQETQLAMTIFHPTDSGGPDVTPSA